MRVNKMINTQLRRVSDINFHTSSSSSSSDILRELNSTREWLASNSQETIDATKRKRKKNREL